MDVQAYRAKLFHFEDDASPSNLKYQYLEDGILHIEQGRVKAIGPAEALLPQLPPDLTIHHTPDKLIMPGFIDTHVHYPQINVIASYGEQLLGWLKQYTWPEEERFSNLEYASQHAKLFLQECFRAGTTTACVFPTVHTTSVEALFQEAYNKQMRLITGKVLSDCNVPDALKESAEEGYNNTKALIQTWHGKGRLSYAVTPRFALSSSEAQLKTLQQLLQEHPDVYLHTHLSEQPAEWAAVKTNFPWADNYLAVYDKYDLVREKSIFAHGIHLEEEQFERLAQVGASLSFCPCSNLFLGSGLFNMQQAIKSKVKVGMGTDIGAGTSFSLLQVLNEAYKVGQLQQFALSPLQAFYTLTLGGAKALSLDKHIGNFQAGKEADFVILDLNATPLISHRLEHASTLEEQLFVLMMLGDDRLIYQTHINGVQVHKK